MKKILVFLFTLSTLLMMISCTTNQVQQELFEPGNGPYLKKVADDLYTVQDFNNGGNVCFLVGKDGVLVVDTHYYSKFYS